MKILGMWKEFYPRTSTVSIYSELTASKKEYEVSIINYLESGIRVIGVKGAGIKCVFTGEELYEMNIYTDGEWAWTSEFIHYLKMQKVEVPIGFINFMRMKGFSIHSVEEIGTKRLGEIGRLFM